MANVIQGTNIYDKLPHSYRNRLHLYKIIRLLLLLVSILALISFCQKSIIWNKKIQLGHALNDKTKFQNELIALQKKYPKITRNAALQTKKDETSNILELHRGLKSVMARSSFSHDQGFSNIFFHLARYVVSDLWLTEINIQKGATDILLNGITQEVEAVNIFLNKISTDQLYKEYTLRLRRMETANSSSGNDSFSIAIIKPENEELKIRSDKK